MKRLLLTSLVAGSLVCDVFAASADDNELFDDRYYVAPMGSLTGNRGNPGYDDGLGGALAVGKSVVPRLGVELLGDYLRYRGKTDTLVQAPGRSIYGGGVGVNYYLSPSNAGLFVHVNAEGGDRFVYNAGLGFDQPFFNRALYLRLELLYHKETNYSAQPLFHIGFRVPLGVVREPVQQQPPPPVAVVPVEQPAPAEKPAPPAEQPAPQAAPPAASPAASCQLPAPGQPISFEGCKVGDTLVLRGVNFEFDKATLTVNAKTLLDQIADALLARKDIRVEIDGYTDGKGSVPYNQTLSEVRAASVLKYLAGRGIDQSRMSSRGFGKSMPIADNATDEGRELNRRVELKVTDSELSAQASEGLIAPTPEEGAASVAAESAPAPAPASKRVAKHHKKNLPAGETPPAIEPAPAPPEPASSQAPIDATPAQTSPEAGSPQAPQEVGPAPGPAPSEPAAPDHVAPAPSSTPAAGVSTEAPAQTEPAPAPPAPSALTPPEPVSTQAQPEASPPPQGPGPSEPTAPDQSAPTPPSAPNAMPSGDAPAQTEPAPAPPGAPQGQAR